MDSPRSQFITALEYFWNGWASARKDILLIVCGSATSWIVKKLLRNHGGLHNRLTDQINLKPFTLGECQQYAREANLGFTRRQIMETYMILGGVPFYWSLLKSNLSMDQNIDALFFSEGPNNLRHEYEELYASLFTNPEPYMKIIEALSQKGVGLTRDEILKTTNLSSNGDFSRQLQELEWSGFIRRYQALDKTVKESLYQLIDNFTLFYHSFMAHAPRRSSNFWVSSANRHARDTWEGLAFERVCLLHVEQMKAKLGISGIMTEEYSCSLDSDPSKGISKVQIDLIINRADDTINLCEMKFWNGELVITAAEQERIERRQNSLAAATGYKKAILVTVVTPFGVKRNIHSGVAQCVITMDDLFG